MVIQMGVSVCSAFWDDERGLYSSTDGGGSLSCTEAGLRVTQFAVASGGFWAGDSVCRQEMARPRLAQLSLHTLSG